jgi:YesN/AraC family two-component response regulator
MLATIDDVEVVAIAANGIQAVQLAKEHHPDIVLLDINMPEMDGLTAFRNIAQIHPTQAVLLSQRKKILRPCGQPYPWAYRNI